ncbi:MAG: hypothetical protein AAFR61_11125 [Bacteroidota bacterium]
MKQLALFTLLFFGLCLLPVSAQKLDADHNKALDDIRKDLLKLKSKFQVSSVAAIENHDRITIEGDWNPACLAELLSLLANHGILRKNLNDGAAASAATAGNLFSMIAAPVVGLAKAIRNKIVLELLKAALGKKDFVSSMKKKIAKERKKGFPKGEEGKRLEKKLEQLYELYELIKKNEKLDKKDKWILWTFDPGNSTLDDFLSVFGKKNSDPTIASTGIARFGTVPDDESPLDQEDLDEGKGQLVLKAVFKGVADKPYPANKPCKNQLKSYSVEILNHGHKGKDKKGKDIFISDYIEYKIKLECCGSDDEDANYDYGETEPISFLPAGDDGLLVGLSGGIGYAQEELGLCVGLRGQYFPQASIGSCGARPGVGLGIDYDFARNQTEFSTFTNQAIKITPEILLLSPLLENVALVTALQAPLSWGGNTYTDSGGMTFRDDLSSRGLRLASGIALNFNGLVIQATAPVVSLIQTKVSPEGNPNLGSTSEAFSFGLNKDNLVNIMAAFAF